MSLFNTIADGVFKFGVSSFFDSKSNKGLSVPRFDIKKFRDQQQIQDIQGSRPVRSGTPDFSTSTGQIQRLVNRHEAIMESFSTEKGAVKGRYGTQSI